MVSAPRDENRRVGLVGASSADARVPVAVYVDPTTHRLKVEGTIASNTGVIDGEAVEAADIGTLILGTDGSNYQVLKVNSDGELAINLETSDIQIGSVELKDSDSAALANIKAANTARTTATVVLATQAIDAAGAVLSTSALATSAKQLADGHAVTIDNLSTNEVYVRGSGTAGTADAAVLTVQGIASMTPLSVTESTPLTGFATSALQLADGHNVTVDNAAGSGVYIRPGTSATFTVDLGTDNDVTIDNSSIVHLEDVTHSTGDAGVMALAVENEDLADLTTGDKDYTPIAVTKEGVVIVKQEGTIAVTESTPLTGFATSAGQLADGHNVTVDNGAAGSAVNIQDGGNVITVNVASAGVASGAFASGSIAAGAVAAGASSFVKLEDAASANADAGVPAMARRTATPADTSGADLDYEMLQMDNGRLWASSDLTLAGTAVSANAGVLDTGTVRVTIATDDEVNNLLGTIDADTGNIATYTSGAETALELIDGAIIGPGEPTIDSITQFAINLNAAANQVLVSSAASKQIWVYAVAYTCSVAGTVSFQDEDDTAVTGIMDHAANSGLSMGPSGNFAMPIWKLGTDKDLEVDVVTAAIDGFITYAIVSV